MQLPSRRIPTTPKVVQRNKPRTLAVKAVIPKASKKAQQLKKNGSGKVSMRGYQDMQGQ